MIIINEKYEEIPSKDNFDIESFTRDLLEFVSKLGVADDLIEQIYLQSKDIIIEYTNGIEYAQKYNGETIISKFPRNAGAFSSMLDQTQSESGFEVKYGISLRSNIVADMHVFIHEFFHFLSSKTKLPYNDDGILYSKSGFNINYYNQKDELVNSDFCFRALTEGTTELLARLYCNDGHTDSYPFQVLFAEIIADNSNNLFKAYFSRDDQDVINFIRDFEARQTAITSSEIADMSTSNIYNYDMIYKYLKGAIEYNLSFVAAEEIDDQMSKLRDMVSTLDEQLDLMLDECTYAELFDEIANEIRQKNK